MNLNPESAERSQDTLRKPQSTRERVAPRFARPIVGMGTPCPTCASVLRKHLS